MKITCGLLVALASILVAAHVDVHEDEKKWERLIYKPSKTNTEKRHAILEKIKHDLQEFSSKLHNERHHRHHLHDEHRYDGHHHRKHLDVLPEREQLKHPKSRFMLEVVTIREKVVVDEKNKPKGFIGRIQNVLFTLGQHGHLKKVFQSNLTVMPKMRGPASKEPFKLPMTDNGTIKPLAQPIPPVEAEKDWFDEWARYLRLDEFWPRLAVSTFLGILLTGILIGLMQLFALIFAKTNKYSSIACNGDTDGDSLLNGAGNKKTAVMKGAENV